MHGLPKIGIIPRHGLESPDRAGHALADAHLVERTALRLVLVDINMLVVGEAGDWPTALAQAPSTFPDIVVVDWDLLPIMSSMAIAELRWPASPRLSAFG